MKTAAFNKLTSTNNNLVLVDFYADWCAPCQTISPMIASVAKEFGKDVNVLKINVDKSRPLAEQFNIRSIPTLLLFRNGKVIWKKVGLLTKKELSQKLRTQVKS